VPLTPNAQLYQQQPLPSQPLVLLPPPTQPYHQQLLQPQQQPPSQPLMSLTPPAQPQQLQQEPQQSLQPYRRLHESSSCGSGSCAVQLPCIGKETPTVAGRNALERKEWTAEEDAFIRHGVATNKGWSSIASQLPGRSDDAVRNRWKRLRDLTDVPPPQPPPADGANAAQLAAPAKPPKRKGDRVTWSRAEDAVIIGSVHAFGHKWGLIAKLLPGRTEHAIRNRYQRLLTISDAARAQ